MRFEELTSLKGVLERRPSEFALEMLRMSKYATGNVASLLELACAFMGLHRVLAKSDVLCDKSRDVLGQIPR